MKQTAAYFGLILSLCVPLLAIGQDARWPNAERVTQLSSTVERTIKDNEKNWSLEKTRMGSRSTTQQWKSGAQQLELRIFVYGSEQEASSKLLSHGTRAVALSEELKGFGGDEARFIDYPHFSWVGIRRGTTLVEVQGPGKEMALTKRFVRHALQELEKK